MGYKLDVERLQYAFHGRPDLIGAIQQAAAAPNWIELFNEITSYVSDLRKSTPEEPASKKRKLDDAPLTLNTITNGTNGSGPAPLSTASSDVVDSTLLEIQDISVVVPQRKKLTLKFTPTFLIADSPQKPNAIRYAWKDIEYAFCLPIPEKKEKQYNYVLFPRNSNLPPAAGASTLEPLVFTATDKAPKQGTISGALAGEASAVSDEYRTLFDWIIQRQLAACGNKVEIVQANEKQFASALTEAYRPKEKAVHVKGFRGSKDGYLFFLPNGILWGFKKPLLFLPKERIAAVSYTSVLQRTFNLNVEVYTGKGEDEGGEEEKAEFEFAMLDQEEFAGIDTYVKRHGLQDASMAEQRRAKRLGINTVKNEDGQKVDVGDPEELAKAEQALQDEEDEEEEDYDPGSEGESEGSGDSTSEEEDGGDGQDDEEEEGEEEEELGSDDE